MKDIHLVIPPQFMPDMPTLALPVLSGSLNAQGIDSKVFDTNVDYYHLVLSEGNIREQGRFPKEYNSLDDFIREVDVASSDLRRVLPFEDLGEYVRARKVVDNALGFLVEPYDASLALMSSSLSHRNNDSSSVRVAINDREKNPYIPYFEDRFEEIVDADMVGIGMLIPEQIIPSFTLAKLIRDRSPETKIIFGGNTFTRVRDGIDSSGLNEFYDFGISSEGDIVLPELVKRIKNGERVTNSDLESISESVPDLESLPKPDWRDIDFSKYFAPEPVATLLGGRGCYFNECTFCAITRVYKDGGKFRGKSPQQVFDEVKELYDTNGVRNFKFVEESHHPTFARDFARMVEESGLPLSFEAFTNMEPVFGKLAPQLARGGYRKLLYGLETVSEDTQLRTEKRTLKIAHRRDPILQETSDAGIVPFTFLMSGIPGESEDEMLRTADYVAGNSAIKNFVVSSYSLDKLAPDADPNSVLRSTGVLRDVELAGDLSCHYRFRTEEMNFEEYDQRSKRIAGEMFHKIHSARPDLAFMATFLPAAREVYIGKYGHDFAQRFTDSYKDLELNHATDRYLAARISRAK